MQLKHAEQTHTSLCVDTVENFPKRVNAHSMFKYLRIRSTGGVCRACSSNPTSSFESISCSRHSEYGLQDISGMKAKGRTYFVT